MADVELEIDSDIATVILNRPAARNAMTLAMWRKVGRIFTELAIQKDVRGIVLTGTGGHFSVGADVAEFADVRGSAEAAAGYEKAVDACADAIAHAPQPVIAAIEGYCLGGGCHLALAADFRFAAPTAAIGIPSAKLSIVYGVKSTQRLLALVGLANAKRLLYSAERLDADAAQRIDLVEYIDERPAFAAKLQLQKLAANAPLSIAGAKAILNGLSKGSGALEPAQANRLIDAAADSADYAEGRRAFAEKRTPRFSGR